MFVSITKYSKKCLSFYCLIMLQGDAYKYCLLIEPEVRDQGKKINSVSVKVTRCRNPLKSSSCIWPKGLIELFRSNQRKMNCFSLMM